MAFFKDNILATNHAGRIGCPEQINYTRPAAFALALPAQICHRMNVQDDLPISALMTRRWGPRVHFCQIVKEFRLRSPSSPASSGSVCKASLTPATPARSGQQARFRLRGPYQLRALWLRHGRRTQEMPLHRLPLHRLQGEMRASHISKWP
jgi:hypothetical protein